MTSPIKTHRPKCWFAGQRFSAAPPDRFGSWSGRRCTCFQMKDGRFPPVLNGTDFTRGISVFIIEWRRSHDDWFVFSWTTASDRASWNSAAIDAGDSTPPQFVIANTATQVLQWVRNRPDRFPDDPLHLNIRDPFATRNPNKIDTPKGNIMIDPNSLRRQAAALLAEAERLDSVPKEPKGIKYKKGRKVEIVWWEMKFSQSGPIYTYAAVKANDGLWYTTGPRAPKGYSWEQLISWIVQNDYREIDVPIWLVDEITQINPGA